MPFLRTHATSIRTRSARARTTVPTLVGTLLLLTAPGAASAQTDFYNLDKGRPFLVEDAFAGKHRAFELKASPFHLLRPGDGAWIVRPQLELKAGILPGIEASVGLHPLIDSPDDRTRLGAGSLELSTLAHLWTESPLLPASAIRLTTHMPLERGDGHGASFEAKGILTRTLGGPFRLHLNGAVVAGDTPERGWFGGALDWVLPFRHTLLMAEGRNAFMDEEDGVFHTALGIRTQLSPVLVLDAGVGRDWSGAAEGSWSLTLGFAREFGLGGWRGRAARGAAPSGAGRSGAIEPPVNLAAPRFQRVPHPFHLVADHNRVFQERHDGLNRLFNAFDYGHGVLYEALWGEPDAPIERLEEEIYLHLTETVLPNGPRFSMPESAFMPRYARLAPRAHAMFEWAHTLHRQSYDVLADPSLTEEEKDAAIEELLDHYLSSDLAFPVVPKGMEIMDEQYFSKAFRERYPKFNGLIWAYHWLQIAVYEPLLLYDDPAEQRAALQATVTRFWQMLADPPAALPSEMPMAPAIVPVFAARYPRLAIIFDNLHMMHDVISDILTSDAVSRGDTRDEIHRQTLLFTDPDAFAVSAEAWIAMALAHGVDAQGGPAVGWLTPPPTLQAAPTGHEHHP